MERITMQFKTMPNNKKETDTLAMGVGLKISADCNIKQFNDENFTRNLHLSAHESLDKIKTEYFDTFDDKNKMTGYVRTIYARPDKVGTLGSIKILLHFKKNEIVILGFNKLIVSSNASFKTIAKAIRDDINAKAKEEQESAIGCFFGKDKRDVKYILENAYTPVLSEDEKLAERALKDLELITKYLKVAADKKSDSSAKKTTGKTKKKTDKTKTLK